MSHDAVHEPAIGDLYAARSGRTYEIVARFGNGFTLRAVPRFKGGRSANDLWRTAEQIDERFTFIGRRDDA